jgi:histidine triad (HIT) family protein
MALFDRMQVVYEDEKCMAFHDVSPVAPVHILVIPKENITQLSKAKAELGDDAHAKVS